MAELSSQDVVNSTQLVGEISPSSVPGTTTQSQSNSGDGGEAVVAKENGIHATTHSSTQDDQALEDGTARSDTDTSRADGSTGDAKSTDARPVKKFATAKPVSFAKYSVPKVIAANAAKPTAEKALAPNAPLSQAQSIGRPRLVAKTTSSLAQKVKPFRAAAPDPMQVWNKNRAVPQPSTKNLTDEELKLQYGIHLTSRLQDNGEGKEAKWADIDEDDEDDWAPETIEWGDGTKTTVNPADATPLDKSATTSKPSTPAIEAPKPLVEPKPSTSFSTSIGPNAKVLKLGARAESQQKTAQLPKGPSEKVPAHSSQTAPAPAPARSPWAKLPPVEKVSPVEINPQMAMPPPPVRHPANGQLPGPSPATEISADSFNRSWRDSAQPQLFMPNSGRYESVPENRRRMSRNEGFRAPAVLQRPEQGDPHAPGPSAAFQTNRTSSDVARRRASSTVSGESGQLAGIRKMSIRSGEAPTSLGGSAIVEGDDQPPLPKAPEVATPAYQARAGGDYMAGPGPGQTDAELEAQRAQQRQLMREQAELARKRRLEDEARQEAEKQERIRQKLLSLGPDPRVLKAEQEAKAKAKAEAEAKARVEAERAEQLAKETKKEEPVPEVALPSPPKPPQPTATGEPQQYGMMKVHPLNSVKRSASHAAQQPPARPLSNVHNLQPNAEEISPEPPAMNGIQETTTNRQPSETGPIPEPIPRTNRPVSAVSEARAGWGRNDHRTTPTSNLWGAPHNKALGNGTFDQTLAGYAPQDLSSRASSTGQAWMNGKTPTVGQSPQLAQIHQHVPETRSQVLQNMTSPEPLPLAINSEADSMQPVRPPAPIGPPPQVPHHQPSPHQQPVVNGYGAAHPNNALSGWQNFHNVARSQDRAEFEQHQRELATRREEEKRTGARPQANYNFDETFKQVHLGAQPDQRHVGSVAQINMPPPNMFGAVGSMPPTSVGPQSSRGSRFFPQQVNGLPSPQPRTVTYVPIELPRSPSPPPAEELDSSHPAYAFDAESSRPTVRFPPERAVVKLPPAKPPTPTAPAPSPAPVQATMQPAMPTPPPQPMTWAARVSMPPPKPVAPLRGVQQPIVQNPSWQERFNGLLGNSNRKASDSNQTSQGPSSSQSALAVTSATKEPLDVMPAGSASVSLPRSLSAPTIDDVTLPMKDVEEEEDLFEDREAGSLPILYFPGDAPAITWPRAIPSRIVPTPPDTQSAFIFLGSPWKEEKFPKQQFAIIRAPGSEKSIKKDLPIKPSTSANGNHRPQSRHPGGSSYRRGHRGGKPRGGPVKAQ
ncbi:hypothetical protein PMZ80_001807 [Knufia obscura]|uniref:Uncharacterized protein n=1 Tax=Knufia obscura TaxID=1635080 RepID=A0ABR0S475_9EURO|nr:hypothetical protein PMZ80_001807 [Knufia obscura]